MSLTFWPHYAEGNHLSGKRCINGPDRKETSAQFLFEYQAPATGEASKSAQPSWIQMGSSISDFWRGGDGGGENMKINND